MMFSRAAECRIAGARERAEKGNVLDARCSCVLLRFVFLACLDVLAETTSVKQRDDILERRWEQRGRLGMMKSEGFAVSPTLLVFPLLYFLRPRVLRFHVTLQV